MKKKINEIRIEMDPNTFAKERGHLKPTDTVKLVQPTTTTTSTTTMEESDILEPEAVIKPQDQATIKYLSNVVDNKTGKVSQPFTIGAQRYQVIRGKASTGEIVMAVFAHDETDDNGENIIHSIEEFEQNIALPMKERLEMESVEEPTVSEPKHDTYEGRKHFLVKKGTNEVRSFSTIKEMLSSGKSDDEEYMGVSEFKKHMNEKMFGHKRKEQINELTPTGEESDEEMNIKAKKLMDMIKKKLPNVIDTIKTPVAQREVIAAFAELVGVPRSGLNGIISGLKDLASEPSVAQVSENKLITKKELEESIKVKKVIKTIKIKDL
jgi:hypothetical protein